VVLTRVTPLVNVYTNIYAYYGTGNTYAKMCVDSAILLICTSPVCKRIYLCELALCPRAYELPIICLKSTTRYSANFTNKSCRWGTTYASIMSPKLPGCAQYQFSPNTIMPRQDCLMALFIFYNNLPATQIFSVILLSDISIQYGYTFIY